MKVVALKASPEVLDVLRRSAIDNDGLTLPNKLESADYKAVDKFLKMAGAKWNRSAKRHLFQDGAKDKINELLGTGRVIDEKKTFNAFYTPRIVAITMANYADVRSGMSILEPSVGSGRLLEPFLSNVYFMRSAPQITGIEINSDVANTQMDNGYNVIVGDFLTMTPGELGLYDRILMNPPFAANQDMKHVLHAFNFLKPGGRLMAIMSKAYTFGEVKIRKEFREFFKCNCGEIIMELDEGTFKESGTNIATLMVRIDKNN